jgi:hypothetical protein
MKAHVAKFAAVATVALGFAFALGVSAAGWDFGPATLRVGSSGVYVSTLQTALNTVQGTSLSTDGRFGPMTRAAVIAFQSSKGLTPDGVVGNMTKAALNAAHTTGGTSTGSNLPAGCTPGALFSSTTGQSCTTSSGGNTSGGPLSGGAGDLDRFEFISSYNNENVGEGEEDAKVAGFHVESDGSDLQIQSLRVMIEQTNNAGSDKLRDYADSVSVWVGNKEVGSADESDFDEDNDQYTATIDLDNAIVEEGDTAELFVAINAASNIDTTDLNNNSFQITVEQVRFRDASGAVLSETGLDDIGTARSFQFETFASAADVELKLREANDNPDSMVVEADDNGETDNVLLLAAKLEAEGSDINIDELTVSIDPNGTGDATDIASSFILVIDGEEVDTIDSGDCDDNTCTGTEAYTFDDLDFDLSEGETVDVEVRADINEIDGTDFVEGDSLTATIDSDLIDATDETDEDLTTSELTGIVNGNAQAFYSEGIVVASMSGNDADAISVDGAADYGQFVIKFSVMAIGQDVYLDKSFASSTSTSSSASGNNRVAVSNSSGTVLSSGFAAALSSTDSDADEETNTFKIDEGSTADFTLTVNATGTNAQARAILYGLEWGTSDSATLSNVYTFDMGPNGDYKTSYVYISS